MARQEKAERSRLMVVDDDQGLRAMLLAALGRRYEVVCLPNGDALEQLIRGFQPDLLILDVNLPDGSGFDLCKRIRGRDGLRSLPVLFMTVRSDDASFVESVAAGGDSFITKPFEMRDLRERIAYLLRSDEAATA